MMNKSLTSCNRRNFEITFKDKSYFVFLFLYTKIYTLYRCIIMFFVLYLKSSRCQSDNAKNEKMEKWKESVKYEREGTNQTSY